VIQSCDAITNKELERQAAATENNGSYGIHRTKMSHKLSSWTERSSLFRHTMLHHALLPTATLTGVLEFAHRHAQPPDLAYAGRQGGGIPPGSGTSDP
jgi:hypothetical protein